VWKAAVVSRGDGLGWGGLPGNGPGLQQGRQGAQEQQTQGQLGHSLRKCKSGCLGIGKK